MFASYRLTNNLIRGLRAPSQYLLNNSGRINRNLIPRSHHVLTSTPKNCTTVSRYLQLIRPATSGPVKPKAATKAIGYWLLGCSGMVFVAVVLGGALVGYSLLVLIICGVTRLTESGLSMVTWKLLGERWPQSDSEWVAEFERYKQFPEFKIKNADMTVSEFKFIFFMEYAHRMWGRCIGAAFALPAIYFWSRGHFSRALKGRVLFYGALIGAQGLLGWYMVKSGLENRFHQPEDVPRVSQYRLASHLSLAFFLYANLIWSAMHHLIPAERMTAAVTKATVNFKRMTYATKGMIFFTALSGALVAGLDAGLVYNTFPKMADRWIPSDMLDFSPTLRNFTENPTTVQFDHRIMGITTLSLITITYLMSLRRPLPRRAYYAATAVAIMGWFQVVLGVTTLLNHVPIPLAAGHQSGSLMLLTTIMWLTHELKLLKYVPK